MTHDTRQMIQTDTTTVQHAACAQQLQEKNEMSADPRRTLYERSADARLTQPTPALLP